MRNKKLFDWYGSGGGEEPPEDAVLWNGSSDTVFWNGTGGIVSWV
jgi:hypothetical protein